MVPIRNTAHEEVPRITPLCPIYQVKRVSFCDLCELSNEKCAIWRVLKRVLTERQPPPGGLFGEEVAGLANNDLRERRIHELGAAA